MTPLALLRSTLSAPFALIAVLFCLVRQHVHITLSNPHTYLNLLRHKCGITALVGVTWALVEAILLVFPRDAAAGPWTSARARTRLLAEENAG